MRDMASKCRGRPDAEALPGLRRDQPRFQGLRSPSCSRAFRLRASASHLQEAIPAHMRPRRLPSPKPNGNHTVQVLGGQLPFQQKPDISTFLKR